MNRYSYTTDSTYQEGNNSRIGANTMDEIITLIKQDLPEGRQSLKDSFTNLERVAEYCEDSYYRSENKKGALEETKNFTTQSLASVAYQINTLASNYIQLLDLQANNLAEMESQMNHISQAVMVHKEKVARREIGVLTANKVSTRQYKIVAPSNPEKPIKYVRKPIDYSMLDDIGHGIQLGQRQGKRASSQSINIQNIQSIPPPTTKPPTPPNTGTGTIRSSSGTKIISNTGTLGKSRGSEYRAPPVVIPPQVPSHYAPNFPIGHPRRQNSNGSDRPGYSSLPMPPSQQVAVHLTNQSQPMLQQPMQHQQQHSLGVTYDDRNSMNMNMPPPPSPLTINHEIPMPDQHHIGLHTLSRNSNLRPGSQSPPLPPPPEEQHLADFGRPRQQGATINTVQPIVPEDRNLPGWVPKNYIEKVVAIYDYYADKDDELSFQESSVIYVLKKNDDGWWEGVMDGVTGLFPGNYVESCV